MTTRLIAASLIFISLGANARIDVEEQQTCRQMGGHYDHLSGCTRLSSLNKSIYEWTLAAKRNTDSLSHISQNQAGCDYRGAAHKEPTIAGLQAVNVEFTDGSKPVIPVSIKCELVNDRFSGSDTRCALSFIQVSTGKFEYLKREIKFNDSAVAASSKITWITDPQRHFELNRLSSEKASAVLDKLKLQNYVDAAGPACQLAELVTKTNELHAQIKPIAPAPPQALQMESRSTPFSPADATR